MADAALAMGETGAIFTPSSSVVDGDASEASVEAVR
jgi:hypothetical protein